MEQIRIIDHHTITAFGITPAQCVAWVEESFKMKAQAQLPPKISLHPQGDDFINTMPCLLPPQYGRMAVKVVSRCEKSVPALQSFIQLFDSTSGHMLALIDGNWITAMRTGAVAALAVKTFRRKDAHVVSMMGLGNTARATALCLLDTWGDEPLTLRLLRYKDQAEDFKMRFENWPNARFEVVDTIDELLAGSHVLVSCITSAQGLICEHDEAFAPGFLLVPVHTRGFQNCDLTFDKIYGDDRGHIQGFKYFDHYRHFAELSDVLLGNVPGRESDDERIISYNIGLGLHDALFAHKIYNMMEPFDLLDLCMETPDTKFWV